MRLYELFNENMDHSKDGQSVPELKAALLARKKELQSADDDKVYDIIDKIMTRIAKSHGISGQKLHDLWVKQYGQIPDTWIMKENFADGKVKEKKLDPDIYGEMLPFATAKSIIQNVVRSVDPQAKLKITQSPEGYYTVEGEKIGLDFGITADAGEINANLVNAFSSYKGAGVVTEILRQCFKAMADLYGQPTDFVISAHQDRGHGVWQAIAQKLGAKWGGSIYENFADGKVKGKSRPGRVKRAGASCAGSVSDLRAKAKKYGGERGKMYHWCANMKGGRK